MTDFQSLGWAAIDWIEHYLVHGPGDIQGQPIDLDDEYAAFVVKAYRVDPVAGDKIVRRAFLSRAKGRAKSELAGMLDCFEALGPCRFDHWAEPGEVSSWGYEYEPGEPVGAPLSYVEILNVATEEGQAGNTYDNAYYMLSPDTCSPQLLRDFGTIDVGLTRTNLPGRRGFIEPVTAANESKDGGKSTFIVADETHLWIPPAGGRHRLGLMHQTMARNLLKRKAASGWMLETSTMYAAGENSVAEGTHAYAESPAGRTGKLLFDHRQAADGHDLTKRADRIVALVEAYGPASAWMPLDDIADSYDDPQVSPAEWERFWTNRPVPLVEVVADIFGGAWELCEGVLTRPPVAGLAVAADVDLASVAVVAAGVDGDVVEVKPLDSERGTGWVVAKAKEHSELHGVPCVVDGRSPAAVLIPHLELAGVDLVVVKTPDVFDACASFEERVRDLRIRHDGNLKLAACVSAAVKSPGERWALRRRGSSVALLEAAILATWQATRPVQQRQSAYADHDLVVIDI